jgi:hypothetical protein
MISEEPTAGLSFDTTQRVAAFNLFPTGSDDAAVEVRKSSQEVERIKGQLTSAEEALKRARAGLPSELTRKDVEDAFTRVDDTLSAMTAQYQARASQLKELRAQIVALTDRLNEAEASRAHSRSMIERFRLLDKKYASDLERLGATSEGVALFDALPETGFHETSLPGIFAVGDARSGSIKRVASAVGEGSACIQQVHRVLALEAAKAASAGA